MSQISVNDGNFLGSDEIVGYPVARRGSVQDSYPLSTLYTERISTNIIRGISPNNGSFIYNDVGVVDPNDESEIIFFVYGYFFKTTVKELYSVCSRFLPISSNIAYVHAVINIDKGSTDFWELTKITNPKTSGSTNTLDYEIGEYDDKKCFIGLTFILDPNRELEDSENYKSLCLVKIDKSSGDTILTINESTKYEYFALIQPYLLCEAEVKDPLNRLNEVPEVGDDVYTRRKLWVQLNYDDKGNTVLRYFHDDKWRIVGSIYK